MEKPAKLPTAWPTDGRSKLKNTESGWLLTHPDRGAVIFRDEKWQMYQEAA